MNTPGFFGVAKKDRRIFWVAEQGLRDFLGGMPKKSSDIFE